MAITDPTVTAELCDSQQIALTERTTGKIVAADQWVAITEAVHKHLAEHPELLDGLLIDLANLPPSYEKGAANS